MGAYKPWESLPKIKIAEKKDKVIKPEAASSKGPFLKPKKREGTKPSSEKEVTRANQHARPSVAADGTMHSKPTQKVVHPRAALDADVNAVLEYYDVDYRDMPPADDVRDKQMNDKKDKYLVETRELREMQAINDLALAKAKREQKKDINEEK
jgi:hypothetical protein